MHNRHALLYHRHRFPAEIIAKAVWSYFRFPLSFRVVEDMLIYHGIIVAHKTVREWAETFGRDYANTIRRRIPIGDKWYSMRLSRRSTVSDIFCGAPLIRIALCWKCWSRNAVIPELRGALHSEAAV